VTKLNPRETFKALLIVYLWVAVAIGVAVAVWYGLAWLVVDVLGWPSAAAALIYIGALLGVYVIWWRPRLPPPDPRDY
jgi:hypothetical protein